MQIPELAAKLQAVGFSDKQAKVYVAALFLGPSAVQKIAEQAEINRATAYVILDELAQMGLVSESTQGKKTVYVAEPPEAIERYLEAQTQAATAKQTELKGILPGLKNVARNTETEDTPVVRFYKGEEGSRDISAHFRRKAKSGSQIFALTNIDEALKTHPDFMETSTGSRLKKKISSKIIYSYTDGEFKSDRTVLREVKKIETPIAANIGLYEKATVFSTYHGKNSVGVVIESQEITAALRQLFEMAWKNQK